jgi:formate-dependent nitrite reductase membrane component NrfD
MVREFTVDYRLNEGFDSLVALNIAIEGSGAALMVGSLLMHYPRGVSVGLALVVLGILFLFFHLGNRFKCWRVLTGLNRAWISRGAFFAGGLVSLGILHFLFKSGTLGLTVQIGIVVFGLLTILYSGFLLSSMTPIPFWNSPLTPILFLLHSTTTGVAILIVLLVQSTGENLGNGIVELMLGLAGVTLLFTIIHIMVMATSMSAARESVRLLMSTGLRWTFLGGAIALGLLVPSLIYIYIYFSSGQPVQSLMTMVSIAMVLRVIGDYAFRSSVLNVGVFEMLI